MRTFLVGKDGRHAEQVRPETKAKAIRLFRDHAGDYDSPWAAMCAISGRLGMTAETLRKWVRQAEVDDGQTAGVPTETAREIRELKRKNAELERTIEILKAATTFFARECDPQRR
jgi:transposase